MNKDPFSYFRFGITQNAAIKGTVNSFYSLFMAIGVIGLLLTVIPNKTMAMIAFHFISSKASALLDGL